MSKCKNKQQKKSDFSSSAIPSIIEIYRLKISFYRYLLENGFEFYRRDDGGCWYIHRQTEFLLYFTK